MAAPTLELPANLANDIAKQLKTQRGPEGAAARDVTDIKRKFCELWPTAKQVLELLKAVIPGGGIIIGMVIALGEGAHKAFCS
jgi:hypothetical protein